jgi:bifunctional non-homologous end joining protein LigD
MAKLPSWVEPQLATLTRERFSDPDWIFERKLDGERCLAFAGSSGTRLMSRAQRDISSTFPEIARALDAQRHGELVVDGEIVAFDGKQTRFGRLQQRLGVVHPEESLLRKVPVFFAQACRDGWEGLVAKQADAPYQGGRDRDWLKFKCENGQEFVIGGYTDPQGSRVGFGALLLGHYNRDGELVYAGKVGTGFGRETLRSLRDRLASLERADPAFRRGRLPSPRGVHWVEPQLVGQVGFSEWTDDGQLRHPRFQGLRDDKKPADVVREMPS